MSGEKITIIVPCYNVQYYLARCMDSLLNQTYQDIEITMVEDCSTDDTKRIVQEYEKKHKNVKAIYNKKNGGLGHARNVALRKTKTKYVAFMDSDDWAEPDYIEELYKAIIKNNADLAICDIYVKSDDPSTSFREKMYDTQPDKFGLINVGLAASSCNKLFKTDVFKGLEYPEDIINEDVPVTLVAMYNYKTCYTSKTYYNYYQRAGSIQNGQIKRKRLDILKAVSLLRENIGSDIDSSIWDAIVWHQAIQLLLGVFPKASGFKYRRDLIKEYYHQAKELNIDIVHNSQLQEFIARSVRNRVYMGSLIITFRLKLFLLTSLIMTTFKYYQVAKHRFTRPKNIVLLLVRDPKTFLAKLKAKVIRKYVIKEDVTIEDLLVVAKRQSQIQSDNPVSVVIPNYNYEKFLLQRLYSILYQTEKVGEVLVLDDNSTDGSVKMARKIKKSIGEYVPIRLINNTQNQGTFRQWEKGFAEARYDYIWIAEADDYSDSRFLESALKPLNNDENVVLSYVNTGFIDVNGLYLSSVKVHIDYQKSGHWDKSYVNSGVDEIKNYSYLNNTIANVSSVVFRRQEGINYTELFSDARGYKQAGDWVLYVNYILYGDIAYTDKIANYYRMHGNNVSSTTKAQDHITEIRRIYDMLNTRLNLSEEHRQAQEKRIEFLKEAWNI